MGFLALVKVGDPSDALNPTRILKCAGTNSNKKHKSGNKQNNQQLLPAQVPIAIPAQVPINMPTLFPQPSANANPTLQNPMVSMPSGFTNQGSNVQYIAITAGHIPPFTYSEFSQVKEVVISIEDPIMVAIREEEEHVAEAILCDHKVRMMLIVWMLLLLTFSKTK